MQATKNVEAGVWVPKAVVVRLKSDLPAAFVFSQVAYWYRPSKNGKSKLRVVRHGVKWLVKSAAELTKELGLTPKQSYRSLGVLESEGLIETKVMMFRGHPTKHIRLTEEGHKVLLSGKGTTDLSSEANPIPLEVNSLTESFAETLT